MLDSPLVSIIVPTYNEAEDIVPTLAAAAAVDYPAKEIVVVDDASTDATTQIVEDFARRASAPVRLVRRPRNRGVAAARNVGLREARGEIAIILNADVRLPSDFIRRILPHYEAGCDYLVVNSRVSNTDYLYPRYVHLMHLMQYSDPENSEWSEGYSCRREAALAVGGFPEEFPGASGEDAVFGQRMRARFRKGYDATIDAPHVVPATWRGFWSQRRGRGRGSAYLLFRFQKMPLSLPRMLRAWLGLFVQIGVLYPLWGDGWRLVRLSPRGWRDWLPLGWARAVDMIAQQVGYTRGWMEIRTASR
ncbi:MAG: glycosyltransferase family 2 protein [Chloroflexi bacterium]|nr:glycosyltransferase family 2 protein [Chloroflexota bacterium]